MSRIDENALPVQPELKVNQARLIIASLDKTRTHKAAEFHQGECTEAEYGLLSDAVDEVVAELTRSIDDAITGAHP